MIATKQIGIALMILAYINPAFAETPGSLVSGYAAEASKATPGFTSSAKRGQSFFTKEWGVSQKTLNCTVCHGKNLKVEGKHAITDKLIAPLAPAANPERFTNTAKVEKWFKRNCKEVLGRECTAAEKADFIQFVIQGEQS